MAAFFPVVSFSQSIYIVNSLSDWEDINLADNICADKFGKCTLRAAIQNANKSPLKDQIYFNLPVQGPSEIILEKALPGIIHPIVIDATKGLNGEIYKVQVFIDGINLPQKMELQSLMNQRINVVTGIRLERNSSKSEIKGIGFHSFYHAALVIESDFNVIQGNYFGSLNPNPENGNRIGISIPGGRYNLIGGYNPTEKNYFLNNLEGVLVGSEENHIIGNYFGIKNDGETAFGNLIGINLMYPALNCLISNNLISGNIFGIRSITSSSTITNNFIGTDYTGTKKIGNHVGISLINAGTDNVIGKKGHGNLISGNEIGVLVKNILSNEFHEIPTENYLTMQGNKIGTDIHGSFPLGNEKGIVFLGSSNLIIGGNNEEEKNLISGNNGEGLELIDSRDIVVQGNSIGTDQFGKKAIPNNIGISIHNSNDVITSNRIIIKNNLISGNKLTGVKVGQGIKQTSITGNKIGVREVSALSLANQNFSLIVNSSFADNCMGGNLISEKNLVFGDILYSGIKGEDDLLDIEKQLTNNNFRVKSIVFSKFPIADFWSPRKITNFEKIYYTHLINRPQFFKTVNEGNLENFWNPYLDKLKDYY